MTKDDIPSKAEHLAQVISGKGSTRMHGVARPVLLRLPVWSLAELDAMAHFGGKSRNAMAIHLLEAGIEEVRKAMDDEKLVDLNAELSRRVVELVGDQSEDENFEA